MGARYLEPLKGAEKQLKASVTKFVQTPGQDVVVARRVHQRHPYKPPTPVRIEVEHAGGSTGYFVVFAHDISDGGVGFFHGGFLYPGSVCHVDLVASDSEQIRVTGKVARCVCIEGRVHFVGVAFEESIDAGLILGLDVDNRDDTPRSETPRTAKFQIVREMACQLAELADHPNVWGETRLFAKDLYRLIIGHKSAMSIEHYVTIDQVAYLRPDGTIKMVNPAWCAFAIENNYVGSVFTNANFLTEVDKSVNSGALEKEVHAKVKRVIDGDLIQYTFTEIYHVSMHERWFSTTIYRDEQADKIIVQRELIGLKHKKDNEDTIAEQDTN